jgi:hypothetical protein
VKPARSLTEFFHRENLPMLIRMLWPCRHGFTAQGKANLKAKIQELKGVRLLKTNPSGERVLSLPKNTPFYLSPGGHNKGVL